MKHPHLTELFSIYQSETQPFRKVHRMIDLFESLIKMHTVVIIAEYVGYNKLSDPAKGMLSQGLRTPSLGTWQLFSRILFEELQEDGYQWTFSEFSKDFTRLDKALNASKTNVIAFRNVYAHGATPTDEQCNTDIKQYEPFLLQLLQSKWLDLTSLICRDNKVWIKSQTTELCLHPILLHKEEGDSSPYAFFNDLKNDKVGLLNYPLSKHYREKDFYREFHEYLPLQEWKKAGNNEFQQRIEELTETFKGRIEERKKMFDFARNNSKGYMSIQGNPGIGKSALIARFFKDLKANEQTKSIHVVEYFIRRGAAQAQVDYLFNYLIRRTDELFPEGREIRAEGRATWELQQQLFSKWRLWGGKSNGSKLLMLIDGLDEGTENNVVTYLPRDNFEGILIIYGSRSGGHKSIVELWTQLPVEHHQKLELTGLGKSDIRALIYEVSNKYDLDRECEWIDAVQQRSQGNPLYLKLLCDAIEQGSIAINDIHALPEKIDEYYKAILDRYAADVVDGDALLSALFTFATAKDYLTMSHIGLINRLGEGALQRIGTTLKEVLYENPLTEAVLDYQLFHESFREYLYKEKTRQVNGAAERIIDFCDGWKDLEGTWEQRYALEHLSIHLSESKREARAEALIRLMHDKDYVQTQQKVLKQFKASNVLYRQALKKAGELKREEDMLEAALCLVDLKYAEANDTPQVVAMVASGDIDHALKRIQQFGGSDKEGMQRKFTLYMLCLMELTLLKSKDKPFRKSAIEKLLNHLDENIPVDHSLLKWNDCFPSYLMFLMACEWAELGLEYLMVYQRTDKWDSVWIDEQGPYTDLQFGVFMECARSINIEWQKSDALRAISTELVKQGKLEEGATVMQEALESARGTKDEFGKSKALIGISMELVKQGNLFEALICAFGIDDESDRSEALVDISTELVKHGNLEEALECARAINDEWEKSRALRTISTELAKHGKFEESLACAFGIDDEWQKSESLVAISTELAKHGKFEESLACARAINYERQKSESLVVISTELEKQEKLEEGELVMQEALECARGIDDERDKSDALRTIFTELAKQGKFEESLACARGINDERQKSESLVAISTELEKQGKLQGGALVMQEALECARGINVEWQKNDALRAINTELVKQGKLEEGALAMQEAFKYGHGSYFEWEKSDALRTIYTQLAKQGKLEEGALVMQESLACAFGIDDEWQKSDALRAISTKLAKQGKFEESLACALGIDDEWQKSESLVAISTELAKQGKFEESLACARAINYERQKSEALVAISTELEKQGKLQEGALVMQEALELVHGIDDEREKSEALVAISKELAKQGKLEEGALVMQEALACARGIDDERQKSESLVAISTELEKQGKLEEGALVMQEALACARGIDDESEKSKALVAISTELAKQDKLEEAASVMLEALECAQGINDEMGKSVALRVISFELPKQGNLFEALICARAIDDESEKSKALVAISTELAKQDKLEEAASVMQEALECAQGINDEMEKSVALRVISFELAKQGKYNLAEQICLEINQVAIRHNWWKTIAYQQKDQLGLVEALINKNKFQSEEAQIFYLNGLAKSITIEDINPELADDAILALVNDSTSMESFLQVYAQHELFFGNPSQERIDRLNKSLNIQWARDIIAQFPKEYEAQRFSTNLSEWIDQIPDGDDREEIKLLARKVAKGKITEQEFAERLKEF